MSDQKFTMYEYKELNVVSAQASFYLDCYEHFGWKPDDHFAPQNRGDMLILKLKRNCKIVNHAELTRLQRNFEADMKEIEKLEDSKTTSATMIAITIGIFGVWLVLCLRSRQHRRSSGYVCYLQFRDSQAGFYLILPIKR